MRQDHSSSTAALDARADHYLTNASQNKRKRKQEWVDLFDGYVWPWKILQAPDQQNIQTVHHMREPENAKTHVRCTVVALPNSGTLGLHVWSSDLCSA